MVTLVNVNSHPRWLTCSQTTVNEFTIVVVLAHYFLAVHSSLLLLLFTLFICWALMLWLECLCLFFTTQFSTAFPCWLVRDCKHVHIIPATAKIKGLWRIFKNLGYFRRRTIVITDQRVTLMKELLTCVKLIKMYAWERPFSKTIAGMFAVLNYLVTNKWRPLYHNLDIRKKERFLLEMTAYVQSISVALTPVVPVLSVIVTFLVHTSLGYDLSPAEVLHNVHYSKNGQTFTLKCLPCSFILSKAFAVVAVMIARVRPSLNGAREALKTWDEANVVWPRYEVWILNL